MLLHGWPDSFYRFHKVIPMLTDPARFGCDPVDAFDLVEPSLAGFGFSDRPHQRGGGRDVELLPRLMTELLGYECFGVQGGDTGSPLAQLMAHARPDTVVGIHLTDIGYDKVMQIDLNDSPTGLAAWIVEQFRKFSGCEGDVERRFTKDELLTSIMIYWVTETINSSMRDYYEGFHLQGSDWSGESNGDGGGEWDQAQSPQRLDVARWPGALPSGCAGTTRDG